MSATSPARPSVVSQALARDRLGVPSVIMFALTAAAPLMVVGALVSSAWGWVGVTGFPLAFVIIAVVLALFSFGYVAMSRHITNAGAFYSYISQGLGRPLGVGGSLVALLAYNLLQIGLYGAFGAFASRHPGGQGGPRPSTGGSWRSRCGWSSRCSACCGSTSTARSSWSCSAPSSSR